MSGNPKKSLAQIEKELAELIEQAQMRKAEQEHQKRMQIEESERLKRINELKNASMSEFAEFKKNIDSYIDKILKTDSSEILAECGLIEMEFVNAADEEAIRTSRQKMPAIVEKLKQAVHRKRRHDEFQKRLEQIERMAFQLTEFEKRLSELDTETSGKFDTAGNSEVKKIFGQLRAAIESKQSEIAEEQLSRAEEALERHEKNVFSQLSNYRIMKDRSQIALGELSGLLMGIKNDGLISRWHKKTIEKLEDRYNKAIQVSKEENFDYAVDLLSETRELIEKMRKESESAQLKADKRKYITDSIFKTLESMGFVVKSPMEEHPGHPATALIIKASSAAGKSLDVSIPIDGEIWYSVGGFQMKSEINPKNEKISTCDQAQAVIEELHEKLAEGYKIRMSELQWDGKDPNRNLRRADKLPTGTGTRKRDTV
ncbi:MAG: hypothetical protein HQM10_19650 [Candidatus Riflebacteria bacterium]|nr:hypothetical protein [Candidatus Riflebacteria bacterium]